MILLENEVARRACAEFFGIMIIVLVINFTAGNVNAPFAIFLVFFFAISLIASSSGAHVNSAVTFTLFLNDFRGETRKKARFYGIYLLAQCLGAFAGGMFTAFCGLKVPLLNPDSVGKAFFAEVFFTFLLCLVVCVLCDDKLSESNPIIAGANVGSCIFITAESVGKVSGGVVNPSIAFGLMLSRSIMIDSSFAPFKYGWLYFIAPFFGGAIAQLIYWFVFRPPREKHPHNQIQLVERRV
eukprot:TRINITY_DN5436_c0_g1_i1.p1 TRINITY_DN5436_c0_g1~~TRINITY_DN5436_c0_g1_i1.p1  ORF type:complete len:240 (+),score=46.92 TRINITY_DN5436_c0_g1_i1:130-849(+)